MDRLQEKTVGSFFGMAVGDAMGLAVRGLKPETVQQYFGIIEEYPDVRPYLGKGIKRFRMQGLYGIRTQCALVVCDGLLQKRKWDPAAVADGLVRLSAGGPEHYFGVYRHPEAPVRKSIEDLMNRGEEVMAPVRPSDAGWITIAVPIALYHQRDADSIANTCRDACLLVNGNLNEVMVSGLTGYLICRLIEVDVLSGEELPAELFQQLLQDLQEHCQKTEADLKGQFPDLWAETGDVRCRAFSILLEELRERFSLSTKELCDWICEYGSAVVKQIISNPAQGYSVTLLPLALVLVLKEGHDFQSCLSRALEYGKEADKLGSLVGALAGALYGFSAIPEQWKSGLVNAREIRTRGEALFARRGPKNLKDLYDMEQGLTQKEFEAGRRFIPKTVKKQVRPTPRPRLSWEDDSGEETPSTIPSKEDIVRWRKFQKDKTRQKRDRRRNLQHDLDDG